MKAISLWQPWATAMALDLKANETRSWPTAHRGELAICSAKRPMTPLEWSVVHEHIMPALRLVNPHALISDLFHTGCVLAVVDLYACVPTYFLDGKKPLRFHDHDVTLSATEAALGDYSKGRFAWLTQGRRQIQPVPVTGRQGLFNLPPSVEAAVRKQLL